MTEGFSSCRSSEGWERKDVANGGVGGVEDVGGGASNQ